MITITTLITDFCALPYLKEFNSFYGCLKRRLYRDLYLKNGDLLSLKREYIKEYGITARHFNSLKYDLKCTISSHVELKRFEIDNKTKKDYDKYLKK